MEKKERGFADFREGKGKSFILGAEKRGRRE